MIGREPIGTNQARCYEKLIYIRILMLALAALVIAYEGMGRAEAERCYTELRQLVRKLGKMCCHAVVMQTSENRLGDCNGEGYSTEGLLIN